MTAQKALRLTIRLGLILSALYIATSCSTESPKPPGPITQKDPLLSSSQQEAVATEEKLEEHKPHLSKDQSETNLITTSKPLVVEPPITLEMPTKDINPQVERAISNQEMISALCTEIGNKLGSVNINDCLKQQLIHSGFSVQQRSLAYRDFLPVIDREPLGKVMVIGGIHGDEFSSVSVVFKWMETLQEHHSGLFHWRFIPSANPDGLVQITSTRQNASGVDLNRNFPTQDWQESALKYWREKTLKNARRFPGRSPNSEPETNWLIEQINRFDPDVIISMHAPYHLVDYDGPPSAPDQLGSLYLRQLGVYPGSMGNYIGVDKNMPIVTVELKSAGIMPKEIEINTMWTDLIRWLRSQLEKNTNTLLEKNAEDISG